MLATVSIVALDKTGTITEGSPTVTDVRPGSSVTDVELVSLAAAAERRSQHPLANAIIREAERRALIIPDAAELKSVMGRGLRATVGQKVIEAGRALLFEDAAVAVPDVIAADVAELEERGRTVVLVREVSAAGDDARWLGVIGIADQPRAAAAEAITALRSAGIRRVVMLTGDNNGVARAIASAVGIDEVRAGLLPEDKVAAVKELSAGGAVVMVGDGVNDAAALAHAAVGVAMGGAGTAAALETADVALMGDDLGRLSFAIGLSRQARAIIRQNVAISLAVIGLLVVASLFGIAGIGWAVVIHEGTTLIVIANALRLLAYGGAGREKEAARARER
jgi:Cd2+/Zn2+-exporting ATPase